MDIGRHGNIGQTRGAVNPAFSVLAESPQAVHRLLLKVNPGPARFRLNPQVFLMIAVLFLALAIPLALVVLGGREILKPSRPAPEIPELRASLEAVASQALPPPAELGGGRRFVLTKEIDAAASRALIEETASALGGCVVESPVDTGGCPRLIVRIPSAAAARFEEAVLAKACIPQGGDSPSVAGLYEIFPSQP